MTCSVLVETMTYLRAGAVELADIVPTDVAAVTADPKLRLSTASGLGYAGITLNIGNNARADTPLGRDARVRQAFSLAIDRETAIGVVFGGQYTANAQAVAPGHPLHAPTIRPPARDVARAYLSHPAPPRSGDEPASPRPTGPVNSSWQREGGIDRR